ncbi:unnamed protein product [Protopolystoma xenopodis]|uniref:Uncharacterized protein n=1 Tax=Protopolystoma xenopodis TaxID=117903 RepID=A0A448WZP1_9PLAT|nr:unnamed protein product [Protopolystoma xenopodis]
MIKVGACPVHFKRRDFGATTVFPGSPCAFSAPPTSSACASN